MRRLFDKTPLVITAQVAGGLISDLAGNNSPHLANPEAPAPLAAKTPGKDATPVFDAKEAKDNFAFTILPNLYEEAISAGRSHTEAMAQLRILVPEPMDFTFFRHGNTTALVVKDAEKSRITVAFDGNGEFGDIVDNLKVWGKPHPLGGKTHSGFSDAIMSVDGSKRTLINRVQDQVTLYANDITGDDANSHRSSVDLHLTGFSRGGVLATAAAAQCLAQGFPPENSNMKLSGLHTFGSPPLGDQEFIRNFEQAAHQHNISHWRVIGGKDSMPFHITEDAGYRPRAILYAHPGNSAYILPGGDGSIDNSEQVTVLINPSKKELDAATRKLPNQEWHDFSAYDRLLDKAQQGKENLLADKTPNFAKPAQTEAQERFRMDFAP